MLTFGPRKTRQVGISDNLPDRISDAFGWHPN